MVSEHDMAWRRLCHAMDAEALTGYHQHATDILVDLVSCPRCRAEHELLCAARARLQVNQAPVPPDDAA